MSNGPNQEVLERIKSPMAGYAELLYSNLVEGDEDTISLIDDVIVYDQPFAESETGPWLYGRIVLTDGTRWYFAESQDTGYVHVSDDVEGEYRFKAFPMIMQGMLARVQQKHHELAIFPIEYRFKDDEVTPKLSDLFQSEILIRTATKVAIIAGAVTIAATTIVSGSSGNKLGVEKNIPVAQAGIADIATSTTEKAVETPKLIKLSSLPVSTEILHTPSNKPEVNHKVNHRVKPIKVGGKTVTNVELDDSASQTVSTTTSPKTEAASKEDDSEPDTDDIGTEIGTKRAFIEGADNPFLKHEGALDQVANDYIDKMIQARPTLEEYKEFARFDTTKSRNWPEGVDLSNIGVFDSELPDEEIVDIQQLVVHWTATPDMSAERLASAMKSREKRCCSVQMVIDRSGKAFAMTRRPDTMTFHALGKNLKGQRNNEISFGIEVIAQGIPGKYALTGPQKDIFRGPQDLEAYTPEQIKTMIMAYAFMSERYGLDPETAIVSHEMIDASRWVKSDAPMSFVKPVIIDGVTNLLDEKFKANLPKIPVVNYDRFAAYGEKFKPSQYAIDHTDRMIKELDGNKEFEKTVVDSAIKAGIDPILVLSLYAREANRLDGTTSVIDGRPIRDRHLQGMMFKNTTEDMQALINGWPGKLDSLREMVKDVAGFDIKKRDLTYEEVAQAAVVWNQYKEYIDNPISSPYAANGVNRKHRGKRWSMSDLQKGTHGKRDVNVGVLPIYWSMATMRPELVGLHLK